MYGQPYSDAAKEDKNRRTLFNIRRSHIVILDIACMRSKCVVKAENGRNLTIPEDGLGTARKAIFELSNFAGIANVYGSSKYPSLLE